MKLQMVPLSAICANPYRNIQDYKLSETKLETLLQSYDTSGFWDGSIQARPHPTKDGKFEIAFGHHRVEAARRGHVKELGLVIAKRSNADMLRMMADENREEFGSDGRVAVETIATVIEAYERGEIELEAVDPKTNKAHIHALPSGKAYDLTTVARFLGWVKPSDGQATFACRTAFDSYVMRESTARALDSIPSAQRSQVAVEAVTIAARSARRAAEKAHLPPSKVQAAEREAAKSAAQEIIERSGFKTKDEAVRIGHAAVSKVTSRKVKSGPPVEFYINKLIQKCNAAEPYEAILEECGRLLPFVDDLDVHQKKELADTLDAMLERSARSVQRIVKALRGNSSIQLRKLLEA